MFILHTLCLVVAVISTTWSHPGPDPSQSHICIDNNACQEVECCRQYDRTCVSGARGEDFCAAIPECIEDSDCGDNGICVTGHCHDSTGGDIQGKDACTLLSKQLVSTQEELQKAEFLLREFKDRVADKDCYQPKKIGPCKAAFERFYFNSDTDSCETFSWGGCMPNGNNFLSEELCRESCMKDEQCRPNEFNCTNGRCIDRHDMCDGRDHCGDGSDEEEGTTCRCWKITIETADESDAGTHEDDVIFKLGNAEGDMSHPRELDNVGKDDFEQAAVDNFDICTENIGINITKIELMLNNEDSWKITKVFVTDKETGTMFFEAEDVTFESPGSAPPGSREGKIHTLDLEECGFLCDNNKCVDIEAKCNGTDECGDGSDENASACTDACLTTQWHCEDNSKCIMLDERCDGTSGCTDGSDESDTNCHTWTITTETATGFRANTNDHVYVSLHDTSGNENNEVDLSGKDYQFKRGATDTFTFKTIRDVDDDGDTEEDLTHDLESVWVHLETNDRWGLKKLQVKDHDDDDVFETVTFTSDTYIRKEIKELPLTKVVSPA